MDKAKPQHTENKMGYMPVNRLLISMALPMIISMLVQALYNIVDSKFVSDISENALTAVSLAFPVQNLMIAVAAGTGVGINALLSRSLGEKNHEQVNKSATHGLLLEGFGYLLFLIFGLTCSRLFFAAQTDIPEIIEMGEDYLSIICIFSVGVFGQITFERLLQSTGRTIFVLATQGTGAVINIILDPIMIFGYCGCPAMGVAGAAAATVIGQCVACILGLVFNYFYNPEVRLNFRDFRPDWKIVRMIYSVGLPSIVMQSISSVMTFGVNQILMGFTSTAAAVFGVYYKLQSFIFMPVFGLNNGMVPILAFNYGARKPERIMKTLKLSIVYAVSLMLVGVALFELIPGTLLGIFNASADMLAIGIPALRIICLSFLGAGFCIIIGSMFQALGNGVTSLITSVCRQLVVLLPVAWLMSLSGNLNAVWWAFPIAEVASLTLSAIFLRRIYREKIAPLGK